MAKAHLPFRLFGQFGLLYQLLLVDGRHFVAVCDLAKRSAG